MRKKNENVKKQNDMIEQMENSRSDEVENEDVLSSHHGTNHSKAISYNDEEISCEISDTDITDTEQSPSFTTSKINRSTISTSVSEKTTINEINEIVKEILSKIQQNTTLTNERLNRIKRYFTESKILTSYESDAFKWITDNIQSIYLRMHLNG
ncbi:2,3-bisphosphoglycerate-independent phosphoglycerate mutase [Dirofilaria immitis]